MERYNFHELDGGAAKDKLNLIELRLLATWEGGEIRLYAHSGMPAPWACRIGEHQRISSAAGK